MSTDQEFLISSSTRRRHKTLYSLLVVAISFTTVAALLKVAQAAEESTEFTRRVYVGAGIGATQLEPKTPNSTLTVSEQNDSGFHVTAGYDFTTRLSAEVYYADLGSAGIAFLGSDVGEIDYQVFGLSAIAYILNSRSGFSGDRNNTGTARREGLSLYGRVGIGAVTASSELDFTINHRAHLALGLGAEYGFRNGFAIRGEVSAFDTDQNYASVSLVKRFGSVRKAAPLAVAVPAAIVPQQSRSLEPEEPAEPVAAVVPYPTVLFDFDSSELSSATRAALGDVITQLLASNDNIVLEGHTDWIASDQYNQGLSERRASRARDFIISGGVEADRIEIIGFGELRPIASNSTDEGRARNRRVEIRSN